MTSGAEMAEVAVREACLPPSGFHDTFEGIDLPQVDDVVEGGPLGGGDGHGGGLLSYQKPLDAISCDQLDGEDAAAGEDGAADDGHRSTQDSGRTTKFYRQSQYPVSLPTPSEKAIVRPFGLPPATGDARAAHTRNNSCDNNSSTSKAFAGKEEGGDKAYKGPLEEAEPGAGDGVGNDDDGAGLNLECTPVTGDLHEFLDTYYCNIPNADGVDYSPEPLQLDNLSPTFDKLQEEQQQGQEEHQGQQQQQQQQHQGNGSEKLVGDDRSQVPGVYRGGIQKKVSNPLSGALQAAMAASSSHTYTYEPIPYDGQVQVAPVEARPYQDDMCTPQSQFKRESAHPPVATVAPFDHQGHQGLERRHSAHFVYASPHQKQQEEIYHGAPIGLAYQQGAPMLHNEVMPHPVLGIYGRSVSWGSHQHFQNLRRSVSANTNSSSHYTTMLSGGNSLKQCRNSSSGGKKLSASASGKDGDTTTVKTSSSSEKSGGGARGPRGSSSKYRGVTQHRRTKRWEAHVWDQGKQVYLGGFESESRAGRAYDVVVLKTRGPDRCQTNFPVEEYTSVIPYLDSVSRDELVLLLRRRSKGFSRGSSKYIGVTKHKCGKWEARISNANKTMNTSKHKRNATADSQVSESASQQDQQQQQQHPHNLPPDSDGPPLQEREQRQETSRKYTYLGLYETELEAAKAHDKAAVACFGLHAHTNFDVRSYPEELALHNPGMKELNMLKLFQGTNELLY